MPKSPAVLWLYRDLFGLYGAQGWWPANSRLEILVGAILTQNTAWRNVEKVLDSLKRSGLLDLSKIANARLESLQAHLRPSGYYRQKSSRLRDFSRWLLDQGGISGLATRPTADLRSQLLAIRGIGPETADAMLLYAFERPVFVIDAYTRRIWHRMGWLDDAREPAYCDLQEAVHSKLPGDVQLFNEYHALLVVHAKTYCRVRPLCALCPLSGECPSAR